MPAAVIRAARRHLAGLEQRAVARDSQADLFAAPPAPEPKRHPALDLMDDADPDTHTPRDALELLYRMKKL